MTGPGVLYWHYDADGYVVADYATGMEEPPCRETHEKPGEKIVFACGFCGLDFVDLELGLRHEGNAHQYEIAEMGSKNYHDYDRR